MNSLSTLEVLYQRFLIGAELPTFIACQTRFVLPNCVESQANSSLYSRKSSNSFAFCPSFTFPIDSSLNSTVFGLSSSTSVVVIWNSFNMFFPFYMTFPSTIETILSVLIIGNLFQDYLIISLWRSIFSLSLRSDRVQII